MSSIANIETKMAAFMQDEGKVGDTKGGGDYRYEVEMKSKALQRSFHIISFTAHFLQTHCR
jgi:hypothetical protein